MLQRFSAPEKRLSTLGRGLGLAQGFSQGHTQSSSVLSRSEHHSSSAGSLGVGGVRHAWNSLRM